MSHSNKDDVFHRRLENLQILCRFGSFTTLFENNEVMIHVEIYFTVAKL